MNFKELIQHLKTALSSAFSRTSRKSTTGKGVETKDKPEHAHSRASTLVVMHSIISNSDTFCDVSFGEHQALFKQLNPQRDIHTSPSVIFRREVRLSQWVPHATKVRFGHTLLK